jgi:putative colanic acid biosynthesis acetyltransferase WcaF
MSDAVQDLRSFVLPKGFRGQSVLVVQCWRLIQATLFRLSPQLFYGWRRWLLRRFGARIGCGARIRPTAEITYPWKLSVGDWSWIGDHVTLYSLGEIYVGDNVVVSQHCYICAGSHDYTVPSFDILDLRVEIGNEVWLAAGVFIAPGVRVGRGTVVGACSVVLSDLPEMMLCGGHPARPVRARQQGVPGDRPQGLFNRAAQPGWIARPPAGRQSLG